MQDLYKMLHDMSKKDTTIKVKGMSASTSTVSKPVTKSEPWYCKTNPDLCCTSHSINLANSIRHMLDVSSIKRFLSRSATVAFALSKADWKTHGKIDAHCAHRLRCSDSRSARACNSAQNQGKCFWTPLNPSLHIPVGKQCQELESGEPIPCAGKVTMQDVTLIPQSKANEASALLRAVGDALSVIARRIDTTGQSALPPTPFDLDRFLLEVVEGDWQDVFAKVESLAHGLRNVDWDKVAKVYGQDCSVEECGPFRGAMEVAETLAA